MDSMKITPKLEMDKLTRRLGGGRSTRLSHSLGTKVRTWKSRLGDLMKPRMTYSVHRIDDQAKKGTVQVNGKVRFKSVKLSKSLKQSREVVCFVATIGRDIEKEINRLMEQNRYSEAYLLDAMGSVAIENMVDQFQKRMESRYGAKGKTSTLRFSPGYCDWAVTEQKKLFEAIDSEKARVELTDSCLMSPRKSVSGIFGLSPKDAPRYNPCKDCPRKNCEARRED